MRRAKGKGQHGRLPGRMLRAGDSSAGGKAAPETQGAVTRPLRSSVYPRCSSPETRVGSSCLSSCSPAVTLSRCSENQSTRSGLLAATSVPKEARSGSNQGS